MRDATIYWQRDPISGFVGCRLLQRQMNSRQIGECVSFIGTRVFGYNRKSVFAAIRERRFNLSSLRIFFSANPQNTDRSNVSLMQRSGVARGIACLKIAVTDVYDNPCLMSRAAVKL